MQRAVFITALLPAMLLAQADKQDVWKIISKGKNRLQ